MDNKHLFCFSREFETRVNELESDNSTKYDKIINLESNLGLSNAECKELQAEMSVINQVIICRLIQILTIRDYSHVERFRDFLSNCN